MLGRKIWRSLFGRAAQERELQDELQHDLAQRIADHERAGLSPETARRKANHELGGVTQLRESCREVRPGALLETILQDVRFGLRTFRLHPGFAIVTVLTLAIGLGANIGVFSFSNAFFLQKLPLPEPDRLVRVNPADQNGDGFSPMSHPNYLDLRDRCRVFERLAVHRGVSAGLRLGDDQLPVSLEMVSGNYFDTFGVRAALGRLITETDDVSLGGSPVAVISHRFWHTTFNASTDAIGRMITVNDFDYTVIGVASENLRGSFPATPTDIWVPVTMHEQVRPLGIAMDRRGWGWLFATGRLREGVTIDEARADLDRVSAQLAADHPRYNTDVTHVVYPAGVFTPSTTKTMRQIVRFSFIVVGLMLILSCINIAGVLLARALGRQHEMSIRQSLGATRGRLLRQMLTETTLLALLGAGLGLLVARWTQDFIALPLTASGFLENFSMDVRLDWRVYLFALGLALLTGLALSLFTVARGGARSVAQALVRASGTSTSGPARTRLQSSFVSGQIAISIVMLIAAGLLLRTLAQARSFDVGFETENMLVVDVNIRPLGLDTAGGLNFFNSLTERLSGLPGVESVTYAMSAPLSGNGDSRLVTLGETGPDGEPLQVSLSFNAIGPDYFDVMQIPVLRGREFTSGDMRLGAPPVIIVNQTLADRYWPDASPVGEHIFDGGGATALEIIGVVRDIKYQSLGEEPRLFAYLPYALAFGSRATIQARTQIDPRTLAGPIIQSLRESDPALRVGTILTLGDFRLRELMPQKILGMMTLVFASLAIFLTAIGLYGSIACLVGRRTHEIGIRMALGASQDNVLRLILGHGLRLTIFGSVVGLAAALGLMRFMESMLFGISAADPTTFIGVAFVLFVVTMLASYLPARRAMKVDPMTALRCD